MTFILVGLHKKTIQRGEGNSSDFAILPYISIEQALSEVKTKDEPNVKYLYFQDLGQVNCFQLLKGASGVGDQYA